MIKLRSLLNEDALLDFLKNNQASPEFERYLKSSNILVDSNIDVYRGMSFDWVDDYYKLFKKFLAKNDSTILKFNRLTSWSVDKGSAGIFFNKNDNAEIRILLKCSSTNGKAFDLNKLSDYKKLKYNVEEELVLSPGNYKINVEDIWYKSKNSFDRVDKSHWLFDSTLETFREETWCRDKSILKKYEDFLINKN